MKIQRTIADWKWRPWREGGWKVNWAICLPNIWNVTSSILWHFIFETKSQENIPSIPMEINFSWRLVSRISMRFRPLRYEFHVLELILYHVHAQYLFLWSKLVYPYIFRRLTAYEKLWGFREAYSRKGPLTTLKCRYSPLPLIGHCQSSNSSTSKTVTGLDLLVSRLFSYFWVVFLSFSPHGPHGG